MGERWTLLFALLTVTAVLAIMPVVSRPNILFGVTVAPDFRDTAEAKRILSRYRLTVFAFAALTAGWIAYGGRAPGLKLLPVCAAGAGAWAWCSWMVRPFAASSSGARSAAIDAHPTAPSLTWPLRLGPYLILSASVVYLLYYYRLLPDPLPVHWSGPEPDAYLPRTRILALRPLVLAGVTCLMLEITRATLASRSFTRRLTSEGDGREPRFFQVTLLVLTAAQYWIVLLFSWIALVVRGPLAADWMSQQFQFYSVLFVALAPLPLMIYLKLHYGQGGTRLPAASASGSSGDGTPNACWKLGQFYFNPDDAAVWVERRAGVGYTLNFARPLSWLWLIGMIGIPLLLSRVPR